jgi:hypothetical protein
MSETNDQTADQAETTEPAERKAPELVAELADADRETAQAIYEAEVTRTPPRSTVIKAAEARLSALTEEERLLVDGEVLDSIPEDRAWNQLLDADGEPVLVDGKPVEVPSVV